MFPLTDTIEMARRHQFHQLEPCGVHGIDYKSVGLDFTGFAELHPVYLLDLKCRNGYMGTYRGCIFALYLSSEN